MLAEKFIVTYHWGNGSPMGYIRTYFDTYEEAFNNIDEDTLIMIDESYAQIEKRYISVDDPDE